MGFEDSDWLLIAMPVVKRSDTRFEVYRVPTPEVADTLRTCQRKWLDSDGARTAGNNFRPSIWFDENDDKEGYGFGRKWAQFRMPLTLYFAPSNAQRGDGKDG